MEYDDGFHVSWSCFRLGVLVSCKEWCCRRLKRRKSELVCLSVGEMGKSDLAQVFN